MNNDFLGQLKQSRSNEKGLFGVAMRFIGTVIGSFIYILIALLKSLVILHLWNNLMTFDGFQEISFVSAYGITAIFTIVTMRHAEKVSLLEAMIDTATKMTLFVLVGYALTFI